MTVAAWDALFHDIRSPFLNCSESGFHFLLLYFLSLSLKYSLNASFTAHFTVEYKPNIKISIPIMMIGNHSILILHISDYQFSDLQFSTR